MIIEAALNGGFTMTSHNPHVPYTPHEVAADAIAAVDTGTAVIHLHVRGPHGGNPQSCRVAIRNFRIPEGY